MNLSWGICVGLAVVGALVSQTDEIDDVARPWREYWKAHRAQCDADIESVRKADGRIVITDKNGQPMPGVECLIRLTVYSLFVGSTDRR